MKAFSQQLSRKSFLHASLATGLGTALGCSSEGGDGTGGEGDGDGDFAGDGDGDASGGRLNIGDGDGDLGGDGDGDGSGGTSGDGDGSGGADASGGSDGSGGSAGDVCTEEFTVTSSGDHTHTLTITAAFLAAGVEGTLTSSPGAGDHTHCVVLTAGDIATIKAGGVVRRTTCNGGDHEFVISCDPLAPLPEIPMDCVNEDIGAPGTCAQ